MQSSYTRFERWLSLASLIVLGYSALFATNSPSSFTLNCPGNVYVSCTAELWNLSIYGNATYTLGYQTYSAGTPVVTYQLNSCNVGTIKRKWTVEDPYWNIQTCTQIIYVSSTGSNAPNIVWPKDVDLEGCNPNTKPEVLPLDSQYPTWTDSECAMLGRSYSDMVFTVNSQCKKVMRMWKVLNWCSGSTSGGYTTYTHTQIIKIISQAPPALVCPPEIVLNATNCKDANLVVNPLTIDPSVCGGNFEITNNSIYATSKGANISGTYPIGTTKVTYTVKYGCGQWKFCTTNVVVKNANKPTPYCIGSLITALMPVDTDKDGKIDNGMVELWAKDLDKGSKSLCGYYPLRFSFSKDSIVMRRTFTCNEIGKNQVPIYITDSKGAQSYCITEIIIQNNGANIPDCKPAPPPPPPAPKYVLRGNVKSIGDAALANADIKLIYTQPRVTYTFKYDTTETLKLDSFINASGYKLFRYISVKTITETKDSTITYLNYDKKTDVNGKYVFDNLTVKNLAVKVSGSYTDAKRKGINSADVEILTKYLLGEVQFLSYPQFLASDIDENGVIDIKDQNALMAFVTNSVDSLPGKTQWYILDASKTYADPKSVLTTPLPYFVTLDSIRKDSNVVNFVGIKKGNISVDPGDIITPDVSSRTKFADVIVTAFPNPTTDNTTFDITSPKDDEMWLRLYASNGQITFDQKISINAGTTRHTIDLSDQRPGIVLYRVVVGGKIVTGLLTKL